MQTWLSSGARAAGMSSWCGLKPNLTMFMECWPRRASSPAGAEPPAMPPSSPVSFASPANADYPKDAIRARAYGAHGIGLCRTEHMFFQEERLPIVQAMILAEPNSKEEQEELDKLLEFQRDDFYGIFKAMDGLPVIIRLI